MRVITIISRLLVGLLFIFSGLLKANDPLGFSYKLVEYFEAFDIHFLVPAALPLAMLIGAFEMVVGFALLLGARIKLTLWLLLLMMVFFTFLTFYSAYNQKVLSCGYFGDAIPLTPWQSFTKDVIMLVLIIILFIGKQDINPVFPEGVENFFLIVAIIASVAFPVYTYNYLPVVDFSPYAKGKNIPPEQMKITNLKGSDYTQDIIENPDYTCLLVCYDLDKTNKDVFGKVNDFAMLCKQHHISFIGLTASPKQSVEAFKNEVKTDIDFYNCDGTVLKTMVRANPGLMLIKGGNVVNIWHYHSLPSFSNLKEEYFKK